MSKSKDQHSDQNLLKIAQKVNLDKDDLKAIKRSNSLLQFQYWKLAIVSYFIGFLGGWVFMSSKDDVSKIGYPISQILIGFNFASNIRTSKARKFLLITICIVLLGFLSGGTLGTFFHPTFNIIGSTSYYGVYANEGA